MKRGLVIQSLPQALRVVKEMGLSEEWDSEYRVGGRRAWRRFFRGRCEIG